MQPIQRITRYELLFKDLCRLTPSCDDPISHAVLDDVLYRLGQTCRNVDEAKDDPEKLRVLENSWLLQDRLHFSDKVSAHSRPCCSCTDFSSFHVLRCFNVLGVFLFAVLCTSRIGPGTRFKGVIWSVFYTSRAFCWRQQIASPGTRCLSGLRWLRPVSKKVTTAKVCPIDLTLLSQY